MQGNAHTRGIIHPVRSCSLGRKRIDSSVAAIVAFEGSRFAYCVSVRSWLSVYS